MKQGPGAGRRGPGMVALRAVLFFYVLGAAFAAEPMLFVYFKEPANMGIFFATSNEGYRWQPLNGGKPWLPIEHAGELMRDPFLTRGPDKEFHLVWTWGWRGTSLGYAHSPDLVHWSEQKEVPIMANIPGAENTWAPEIYWDGAKSQWMLVWSSRVPAHVGNRIYQAWTADFKNFSKPELFWDPGYPVIDATILQTRGRYYMVFKDETVEPVHRWLKIAEADKLEGPYRNASEAFTESWSEGPSAAQVGNDYIVYYDHYRDPRRYEAVRSSDLKHWTPINDQVQFPENCKHGSFLKISEEERDRLSGLHGALPAVMAQSLPDLYHDEKHGDPPYLSEAGWRPLLNGRDLSGWHADGGVAHEWFSTASVEWKRVFSPTHLTAKTSAGDRIVNGKDGKTANLVMDQKFGSFELYLEFLLAKGSNSGVFLHGLYEIQIFDSFGYDGPLTVGDCGGIYEQVEGGGGSPPARNAMPPSRPASGRVCGSGFRVRSSMGRGR
ncbi:conserved exported hypothetical protein [Candidatus Sulfopaludibacter sp. SbA3]|nr:conserved exported hypothetical protein [Candidatus Sulfopaludibacter sp. SbA3]